MCACALYFLSFWEVLCTQELETRPFCFMESSGIPRLSVHYSNNFLLHYIIALFKRCQSPAALLLLKKLASQLRGPPRWKTSKMLGENLGKPIVYLRAIPTHSGHPRPQRPPPPSLHPRLDLTPWPIFDIGDIEEHQLNPAEHSKCIKLVTLFKF